MVPGRFPIFYDVFCIFYYHIVQRDANRYFFVNTNDIIHISAEEKYIEIHTDKGKYLIRETMNSVEESLDPQKFARIHRSFIVNIDQIKEMQPWSHGDYVVVLKNGEKIQMSRRYRENLFSKKA